MNNYQPYPNSNYMKNNYMNANPANNLFDPYDGFIRGNMFPNLYQPYKKDSPYEIQPMNEQAQLLTYLDALHFATIDLNLYLDVHPDNKNMIDLFNQYRTQHEKIKKEYENKYGPLLLCSDSLETYPWAWDDQPWPWQNK